MRSFDARATTYDNSRMHRWVAEQTAAALAPTPSALLIDAAAGTGLAGRWLLGRDRSNRVLAIDLSSQLLAAGRQRADGRLWAVQADAALLPLRSECVDGVVCASAMAYMTEPAAVLAEFARVLRSRGRLAVQVWAADGLLIPALFRRAAASIGLRLTDPNGALGHPARLEEALARAGFTDIDLVEHTWREPLPEGESAWTNILQSTAGAAVHALPPGQQQLARENFLANLTGHRAGNQTDAQRLYVATGTRS
jgi:SAM-dependent methyltransferase